MTAKEKYQRLLDLLRGYGIVAVAFSGGVDSTLLLAAAKEAVGDNCIALTAVSEVNPKWETAEADQFCLANGIRQIKVVTGELMLEEFASNPPDRCYICKKEIFGALQKYADREGAVLVEGSNMDDLGDYRPGLKAIAELDVKSPLRDAELYKAEIRELSEEMNLPTWSKPSFACLASRIPYGERITAEKLNRIDLAEEYLKNNHFPVFRVRCLNDGVTAKIEVDPADIPVLKSKLLYLTPYYKSLGFQEVLVDENGYKMGALNEALKEK